MVSSTCLSSAGMGCEPLALLERGMRPTRSTSSRGWGARDDADDRARALELKVSDEPDELIDGICLVAGDTSRITLEGPAHANPHTRLREFE